MAQDLIGRNLGKYRIVARLGRGGMAEVYKAFQPSLDRYVAVKVLHTFMAEEKDFLARFRREAKNVAALRHPNIVQVFDFDVEDEQYYMVMEFLDGPTLKSRLEALHLQGKRLPLKDVLRITRDVGSALGYAHERGIVHRDVKPANVILEASGRVILTDFGVAKILTGTQFTATGTVLGTPAYMAPEQGLGQPGDGRSDIYSLGVMLYEMATGRLPFDADTPLAVVMKHIHDPLPLPRLVTPDLPESLERVILRALAKDPADRYDRVEAMLSELEAVGAAPSVEPPRPSAPVASGPKRSGSALALALGGGLGVLVCAAGVVGVGIFLLTGGNLKGWLAGGSVQASETPAATRTDAAPIASRTARPTARDEPTASPTAAPTLPEGEVLLQDDFSDSGSGWDRVSDDTGGTDYSGGAYRIWVDKSQADRWANPGISFTDVRIVVDTSKAAGPDNNDFGVICRYRDSDNFYAFWISSDGFAGIIRYLDGDFLVLSEDEQMQASDQIHQGYATNHLRADCVGSTLRLYVNGELVEEVEDASHAEGDVGLMAGTFNLPGVDIHFDNFVVLAP